MEEVSAIKSLIARHHPAFSLLSFSHLLFLSLSLSLLIIFLPFPLSPCFASDCYVEWILCMTHR
jgi:hypothetical protein